MKFREFKLKLDRLAEIARTVEIEDIEWEDKPFINRIGKILEIVGEILTAYSVALSMKNEGEIIKLRIEVDKVLSVVEKSWR